MSKGHLPRVVYHQVHNVYQEEGLHTLAGVSSQHADGGRAFAVKVATKRLPVFPFPRLLEGCKGHQTHRFENGGTNQIRKMGKREVVFLQPLPQTLYPLYFLLYYS